MNSGDGGGGKEGRREGRREGGREGEALVGKGNCCENPSQATRAVLFLLM